MKIVSKMKVSAVLLAMVTAFIGVTPKLNASVVPLNVAVGEAQAQRQQDLKTIQSVLERKVVQDRLQKMGLTEKEVSERLGRLSDGQLHQVAQRIDKQHPAGDSDDTDLALGVLLGVLLIGLVVWILKVLD